MCGNSKELSVNINYHNETGDVMVLDSGLKPIRLGLSPQELSFLEGRKLTMEEILAIYGVPKTKLGIGTEVNRASAYELEKTFQNETILPRLRRLESKLNEKLLPMWDENLFCEFENPVPEDPEIELKKRDSDLEHFVTTVNEVRIRRGDKPVPWGETPLAPMNIMPLISGSSSKFFIFNRNKKNVEQFKERKLENFIRTKRHIEEKFIPVLKDFFTQQKKQILANLRKLGEITTESDIDNYILLPVEVWAKKLTEMVYPYFYECFVNGVHIVANELRGLKGIQKIGKDLEDDLAAIGMDLDTFNDFVQQQVDSWEDIYGITINETMMDELKQMILDGFTNGKTISEISDDIVSLYQGYTSGKQPWQATRIARTETCRVMCSAELESYISAGITTKMWLTNGEDPCEICQEQEAAGVIDINDAFPCGEQHPPAHPNCECDIIPGEFI